MAQAGLVQMTSSTPRNRSDRMTRDVLAKIVGRTPAYACPWTVSARRIAGLLRATLRTPFTFLRCKRGPWVVCLT